MTEVKERKVKKYNEHLAEVEIAELKKKYLSLAIEYAELLKKLDAKSITDFENKINTKSGFANPNVSADAYGLKKDYNHLLQLKKTLEGKLSLSDLTKQNTIKIKRLEAVRQKHTEYYNANELEVLELFEKAIKSYNNIPFEYRNRLIIDRQGNLVLNPFHRL